jgi:PIN domain nuclease of toxin-antitoxin system
MNLLLDTCSFLWLVTDDPRLSQRARLAIADPENDVSMSAASAWEISVKYALGRLPLPLPPHRYVPDARMRHGVTALPVHEEEALAADTLPQHHRDPFDRLLVCQALLRNLTLVTPDPLIGRYPARVLW